MNVCGKMHLAYEIRTDHLLWNAPLNTELKRLEIKQVALASLKELAISLVFCVATSCFVASPAIPTLFIGDTRARLVVAAAGPIFSRFNAMLTLTYIFSSRISLDKIINSSHKG